LARLIVVHRGDGQLMVLEIAPPELDWLWKNAPHLELPRKPLDQR
jgi:hypothetical protein